jgi:hypothetical protein
VHALPGYGNDTGDLADRARLLAVRLPGVGIRPGLRRVGGAGHRAPGGRARRHLVRHRGALRLRPQRTDPRCRASREPGIGLPGDEALPAVPGRPRRRAARGGQREPARRPPSRPVPGTPAEPAGQGRDDHARHARAAAGRAGRRGRRQQLLAGPLARRRAGPGQPGAEQPGPLQPGRPLPGAGPAAVRRLDRPRRDRLQPARPGPALRPVPPGQPAVQQPAGRQPAVPAGQPRPGRRPDRGPARGGRRALRHAGPDRAGLGYPAPGCRRDPRRVERGAAGEQRGGRRYRPGRRRVPGPGRGSEPVPPGHRPGCPPRAGPGPLRLEVMVAR